jgi:hypothetical protein
MTRPSIRSAPAKLAALSPSMGASLKKLQRLMTRHPQLFGGAYRTDVQRHHLNSNRRR